MGKGCVGWARIRIAYAAEPSYQRRYELFCRKLVLERYYTASAFITSSRTAGMDGEYDTPPEDVSMERFAKALIGHIGASL